MFGTGNPVTVKPAKPRNEAQYSELLRHLDHVDHGNKYIAWYGQLRAEDMTHTEALEATIQHWGLRDKPWWKSRGLA